MRPGTKTCGCWETPSPVNHRSELRRESQRFLLGVERKRLERGDEAWNGNSRLLGDAIAGEPSLRAPPRITEEIIFGVIIQVGWKGCHNYWRCWRHRILHRQAILRTWCQSHTGGHPGRREPIHLQRFGPRERLLCSLRCRQRIGRRKRGEHGGVYARKAGYNGQQRRHRGSQGVGHCRLRRRGFHQRAVFRVNALGAFLGTKHAARVMKPVQRGSIINTASVAGIIGGCPHAYTCSKHAIVGLTKNTALDLGRYGIRVNCVSPHAVPTRMSKTYLGLGEEDKFDVYSDLKGVEVRPEDVADAFLYLASDESRYVNGHNLLVDGGFTVSNSGLSLYSQ
nr:secoisolariciresinol dehydrogenase-like [Ipomoea batatas]